MAYVEVYVLPVTTARFDEYADIARRSADIWLSHGALSVTEARADNAPQGEHTSFPQSVRLEPGEEVVFSTLTFRDRAHRDAVMEAAMSDAQMMEMMENAPIDGRRMFWGGFVPFVDV